MIDDARLVEDLLAKVAGEPRGMLHLAQRLQARGAWSRAANLCADLLELPEVPPLIAIRAKAIVADGIPPFHRTMVLDHVRNQAYRSALQRIVRPGMRVLEIGTGAGLLAMMAVRAGAGHVYTCETDPLLARIATQVVAANNLTDRITVIPRHSSSLDAVADLGGPVDLLISEIIGDRLIDEGVLASHAEAASTLLSPGAVVIPLRGSIQVALVDMEGEGQPSFAEVEGFDLTALGRLRPSSIRMRADTRAIVLRSEPTALFQLPLDGSAPLSASAAQGCRSTGGRISGVLQWIAFDLDETTTYDNRPRPDASSHWWVNYHPLHSCRDTAAGDTIEVNGWYDRAAFAIWLE